MTVSFNVLRTYVYRAVDEESRRSGWFVFKIVRKHGSFRAYVEKRPPIYGRDTSISKTHMYRDGKRFYVCVVNDIRSREKMEAVARLWARRYLRYAATGKDYNE